MATTDIAEERGTIRRADSGDIGAIIALGWENAASNAEYRAKLKFDRSCLLYYVGAVLADDKARVIVYESNEKIVGVFAFTTYMNFYYFAGELVANMIIWSVSLRGLARGRVALELLSVAQKEARDLGAKCMILTGAGKDFGKLVKHCGYEYLESSYITELS